MQNEFPVIEIFGPTIQGEGAMAGKRSHFIRFGGCSYRCSWCDSMHAVDPEQVKKNATRMSAQAIVEAVRKLDDSNCITLSGGDPAMWDLDKVITRLNAYYYTAVETQGAIYKSWLKHCNLVTVSPKPPSSGMQYKIDYEVLYRYVDNTNMVFKVVIFTEDDLEFACKLHEQYPKVEFYLSVGTPLNTPHHEGIDMVVEAMREIFEAALKKPELDDVTILPQLHYLAWGSERGR